MAVQPADTEVTLAIDERIVVSARCSQCAAADGRSRSA